MYITPDLLCVLVHSSKENMTGLVLPFLTRVYSILLCIPFVHVVWGANDTVRRYLGGARGDFALIWHCLISLSKVATNTIHLWATADCDNT
jgi:hypothetical protein